MSMMERDRLNEDARFELSLAAMSHERRNRPLGLVIVAAGALVLALAFAAYGLNARGSSRTELVRAVNDKAHIEAMTAEWTRLHVLEQDPTHGRAGRPMPRLLSRMEELAAQAGLSRPQPPREVPRAHPSGVRVIEYHYGDGNTPITHQSLTPMLEWLRLAQDEDLGMELIGLQLRPDANNWRMTAIFRRWERAG